MFEANLITLDRQVQCPQGITCQGKHDTEMLGKHHILMLLQGQRCRRSSGHNAIPGRVRCQTARTGEEWRETDTVF